MKWVRNCYGIEETVEADIGSRKIYYKTDVAGERANTYNFKFKDGIPVIRRYGKDIVLNGFSCLSEKGLSLAAYLNKKKANKKAILYTYKAYQQFLYFETKICEDVIKECVSLSQDIIDRQQETPKEPFDKVLERTLKPFDENIHIINGFNAKRIKTL